MLEIRREFRGENEKSVKVAELKKIEQGSKTIKKFMQEFKKVAKGSRYRGCLLIEEFKQGINAMIRKKLIEVENQPSSIEQ